MDWRSPSSPPQITEVVARQGKWRLSMDGRDLLACGASSSSDISVVGNGSFLPSASLAWSEKWTRASARSDSPAEVAGEARRGSPRCPESRLVLSTPSSIEM